MPSPTNLPADLTFSRFDDFDEDRMNRAMTYIVARLLTLDNSAASQQVVIDQLQQLTFDSLNQVLAGIFDEARALQDSIQAIFDGLSDSGINADQVAETAARIWLTPSLKAAYDACLNTSAVNALISSALSSPTLGSPNVTTAPLGTNTSQAASTSFVANAIAALINGAPAALDTLYEIAQALNNDATAFSDLLVAIGNRLRVDAAQGLNGTQQTQARANLGLGNIATHATSEFQAALGFTPVQQGTGIGQSANIVKIGWSVGGKPKLTVDSTDLGNFALENWVNANFPTFSYVNSNYPTYSYLFANYETASAAHNFVNTFTNTFFLLQSVAASTYATNADLHGNYWTAATADSQDTAWANSRVNDLRWVFVSDNGFPTGSGGGDVVGNCVVTQVWTADGGTTIFQRMRHLQEAIGGTWYNVDFAS